MSGSKGVSLDAPGPPPPGAVPNRSQDGIVLRPFAGKGLDRVIALLKRRDAKDSPAAAELLGMLAG